MGSLERVDVGKAIRILILSSHKGGMATLFKNLFIHKGPKVWSQRQIVRTFLLTDCFGDVLVSFQLQ